MSKIDWFEVRAALFCLTIFIFEATFLPNFISHIMWVCSMFITDYAMLLSSNLYLLKEEEEEENYSRLIYYF